MCTAFWVVLSTPEYLLFSGILDGDFARETTKTQVEPQNCSLPRETPYHEKIELQHPTLHSKSVRDLHEAVGVDAEPRDPREFRKGAGLQAPVPGPATKTY